MGGAYGNKNIGNIIQSLQTQVDRLSDQLFRIQKLGVNAGIRPIGGTRSAFGPTGSVFAGMRAWQPILHIITDENEDRIETGIFDRINLQSSSVIVDADEGRPLDVRWMQQQIISGNIVTIKPVSGKTMTLKTGGNIDIAADITISSSEFVYLQYFQEDGISRADGRFIVSKSGIVEGEPDGGDDPTDEIQILDGDSDPINTEGENNDLFFQTETEHIWRKIDGEWNDLGSIIGIPGGDGTDGDDGADGQRGTNIVSRREDPGRQTVTPEFMEGDKILNIVNGSIWEVVMNIQTNVLEWTRIITNIIGDDGTDGNDGTDGTDGADGQQGPPGPPGISGLEGGILGGLEGEIQVNFNSQSPDHLTGTVNGDIVMTFFAPPAVMFLEIRLNINIDAPSITIGGHSIAESADCVIGDVLTIEIRTFDVGLTYSIFSVKKNDDLEEPPSTPTNFSFVGRSQSEIIARWHNPISGTLPVTFDIAYATSPSEDSNGAPNHSSVVMIENLIRLEEVITGLNAAEVYYGWIRAKNEFGESNWEGGIQTNTDAPISSSLLGLTLVSPNFRSAVMSWATPQDRTYSYVLTRSDRGETDPLLFYSRRQDYTDTDILPGTEYTYTLTVYNELDSQIFTIPISIAITPLPVPSGLSLETNGDIVTLSVTKPAGIRNMQVEWSQSNAVGPDGSFTERPGNDEINKPYLIPTDEEAIVFFERTFVAGQSLFFHVRSIFNNGETDGERSAWSDIVDISIQSIESPNISRFNTRTSSSLPNQVEIDLWLRDAIPFTLSVYLFRKLSDDEEYPTVPFYFSLINSPTGRLLNNFIDDDVRFPNSYDYRAVVSSLTGTSFETEENVRPEPVPSPLSPRSVSARRISDGVVQVTWNSPFNADDTGPLTYTIRRIDLSDGPVNGGDRTFNANVTTTEPNVSVSYTDTDFPPEQRMYDYRYRYAVTAINVDGVAGFESNLTAPATDPY